MRSHRLSGPPILVWALMNLVNKVIKKIIQSKWETQSSILQKSAILKSVLKIVKLKRSNSKIIINFHKSRWDPGQLMTKISKNNKLLSQRCINTTNQKLKLTKMTKKRNCNFCKTKIFKRLSNRHKPPPLGERAITMRAVSSAPTRQAANWKLGTHFKVAWTILFKNAPNTTKTLLLWDSAISRSNSLHSYIQPIMIWVTMRFLIPWFHQKSVWWWSQHLINSLNASRRR